MPIYEFSCTKCSHTFELLMGLKDPVPRCPACGYEKTKRLMSCGAIRPDGIPKGSGGFHAPSCSGRGCKK
ncbi:zinc ribbon domain-containing protein [Desulfobotulus sp. H1]|uniref:Zinc ribbon domain-containing protein n=1 Tax=Desulfobotulus pelophilus TaxID=2823377 RepID=A0ABT3N812_9BACT|nr:zinc ribbon domain-containing protein [Desulfobotulus pelophilus]MCW7753592.1 zinc ribbon domain-containing protein [Desulfobotulus pelophilus]